MAKSFKKGSVVSKGSEPEGYAVVLAGITELLQSARQSCARAINALMTAVYWEIGRRIVEYEQQGAARAGYGERLLERLSADLGRRFARGLGRINLRQIPPVYLP